MRIIATRDRCLSSSSDSPSSSLKPRIAASGERSSWLISPRNSFLAAFAVRSSLVCGLQLRRAAQDLRLHLRRLPAQLGRHGLLLALELLEPDELGHVLDRVDDVFEPAGGVEHRRVDRAPVAHLVAAALVIGLADVVLLDGHRVGQPRERTRSSDARRLPTPVASSSSGLSGNTSKIPRPTIASRLVIVAER